MITTPKNKSAITSDLIAGLTSSIPSIPDGMASGILAGVDPINGLYSWIIGTPIAALFTGSAFISVQVTSAMAITIGATLGSYPNEEKIPGLITIVLVIGAFMIMAGCRDLVGTGKERNKYQTGKFVGPFLVIIALR
jgi:SulP family sulfate permease